MAYVISGSLLSANWAFLARDAFALIRAGVSRIHLDVMDQHFVSELTFGPGMCRALRDEGVTAPIDVHLMTSPVTRLIEAFAKAGASSIAIHPEACVHPHRELMLIRELGCEAVLVLNPGTPLSVLEPFWECLDGVLLMSVNPGFAGQTFIPATWRRLEALAKAREAQASTCTLAVDGGIKPEHVGRLQSLSVDVLVVGSALFGEGGPSQCVPKLLR